jgi:hypothetical protein
MMLITGATGNVGREAMRLLGERAVGLSRTRPLESVDHLEGVLYSGPEPLTQGDKVRELGRAPGPGVGVRGDLTGAGAGEDAGRRLAAGDPGAIAGITGGLRAIAGTGVDQRG